MRVLCGLRGLDDPRPLCLAIGVFDGVHLGHQAIVRTAVERARAYGGTSAVLTFEPHPDAVLRPERAPLLLTTTEEKLALLRSLGVRLVVLAPFDPALASTPAEAFVRLALGQDLRARCVIVGQDWRFGARGTGTPGLLRRMAPEFGFRVSVVAPVLVGGRRVSSTRIRALLTKGQVGAAARCLGRWYEVAGAVVAGEGRGRRLGFPTANVAPPPGKLLPADGVYACWSGTGRLRPAVASIGVRPTFEEAGERRLEVHLLEARPRASLLGRKLRVRFAARLREERRFGSEQELVRQMEGDARQARLALALQPSPDVVSFGCAGA